ncbi:MAG: AzlC family ABC transporter permease [Ilumatobacteraceae bacterium]
MTDSTTKRRRPIVEGRPGGEGLLDGGPTGTRSMIEGARDITPMVIGVIPFALAIGAAIGASTLTRAEGLASGPIMLAGSAQLATVRMIDAGVAPLIIVLSAIVINARLLLYGASLAPWFAGRSLWARLLLAIPVIDQMHFTCDPRFERGDLDEPGRVAYYAGAAMWLVGAWVGAQAAAIVAGAGMPESLGLEIAAPLAMVGLLAKSTTGRPSIVAAAVGFTVAVVAVGMPLHSSVLAASIGGIAAGWLTWPPVATTEDAS